MTDYPSDTLQKVLALCGFFAPIMYVTLLTVLGLLWSGYCPISQFMSELGAADSPFGRIMQFGGFSLLGIFWLFFSIGIFRGVKKHLVTTISVILLVIGSISMIAVGFFPCDPGCNNVTFTGQTHSLLAMVANIAFVFGMLIISYPMWKDPNYGGVWRILTLVLAIISNVLSPLMMLPIIQPIIGLIQRAGILVPLLWTALTSLRLFRLASK